MVIQPLQTATGHKELCYTFFGEGLDYFRELDGTGANMSVRLKVEINSEVICSAAIRFGPWFREWAPEGKRLDKLFEACESIRAERGAKFRLRKGSKSLTFYYPGTASIYHHRVAIIGCGTLDRFHPNNEVDCIVPPFPCTCRKCAQRPQRLRRSPTRAATGAAAKVAVSDEQLVLIDKSSPEWSAICDLLKVSNPAELGVGRDVLGAPSSGNFGNSEANATDNGDQSRMESRSGSKESRSRSKESHKPRRKKYTTLRPVHAWKIHNPDERMVYTAKRAKLQKQVEALRGQGLQDVPVTSKLDSVAKKLGADVGRGELLLLHGTRADSVLSILHNGLNERLSGGVFGEGIYAAEDAAKADQYCVPERTSSSSDPNLPKLSQRLYGAAGKSSDLLYCFAVRAAVGLPIFTLDGEHNLSSPHQVVYATAERRELIAIPGSIPPTPYHALVVEVGGCVKRHREFVFFDGGRLYLEYLIAFVRE